jgi:hypothetical protein
MRTHPFSVKCKYLGPRAHATQTGVKNQLDILGDADGGSEQNPPKGLSKMIEKA